MSPDAKRRLGVQALAQEIANRLMVQASPDFRRVGLKGPAVPILLGILASSAGMADQSMLAGFLSFEIEGRLSPEVWREVGNILLARGGYEAYARFMENKRMVDASKKVVDAGVRLGVRVYSGIRSLRNRRARR